MEDDARLVILVGVGEGLKVDELERESPSTRVLVVEPRPDSAAAMLARRDWSARIDAGLLRVLVGPDYAGADEAWRFVDEVEKPRVLVSSSYQRDWPAETAKAKDIALAAVYGARANADARRKLAPRYLCNTIRNTSVISRSANVDALKGAMRGVPAVIVAAGPSLDRQIEELRWVGSRAVVIAVDTAVRPLLDAGIYPDLAVALDPSAANARHLRDISDPRRPFLVAEGSMDPEALAPFDGRLFVFEVSGHHPWPWLRSIGIDRGRLRAWGSVLTAAFDLALEAGCDPIVFVGADLAYSEGRPYARGTTFEDDWADRVAGGETLDDIWRTAVKKVDSVKITGCNGAEVTTGPQLLEYRNWIVAQSGVCGRRIVNTTGAGALEGPSIEQRTLESVLATLPEGAWARTEAIRSLWREGNRTPVDLASAMSVAPLDTWLAFGGPGLRREDIAGALADAMKPAAAPIRLVPDAEERPALPYAPERVALIREAIAGRSLEGVLPGAVPALADAVTAADRHLTALIAMTGPLVGAQPDVPAPVKVPASRAFPWQPRALPTVRAFETALSNVIAARTRSNREGLHRRFEVSCELLPPGEARTWSNDVPAIIGVISDYAAILSRDNSDSAALRGYASMIPADADCVEPLRVAISVAGHEHALVADGPRLRRSMADVLAGRVIAVDAERPARIAAWWPGEGVETGRVSVSRIGGDDLRSCIIGGTLDGDHAVFADFSTSRSIRVAGDGRWDVHADWPQQIAGVVRWGRDGAVAWRNPHVMWRSREDEAVRMTTIPFRASLAYPQLDGSVWWTSFDGGVWSWTPGGEWRRLIGCPPIMSLRREGDVVRLDPRGSDSTFARRPEANHAYYWTPASATITRRPLGPEGPMWSTASRNGWTASAFPWGDQIGLDHVDGTRRLLVSPAPFTVAWAGGSLIVSTREGRLVRYERLWDALEETR